VDLIDIFLPLALIIGFISGLVKRFDDFEGGQNFAFAVGGEESEKK